MSAQQRTRGPAEARPPGGRGARTREALVAAAREVFERDGYFDARIVDITAAAGVATGSFYTYFRGKDEIFAAVLAELQDEMMHAGVGSSGEPDRPGRRDLRRGVEDANRAYLESYRRNARLMAALEQLAAVNPTFQELRLARWRAFIDRSAAAIARLQEAGLADRELDPLLAARAINGMVSRMAYVSFVAGEKVPFEDLVQTLTQLWVNALRMPVSPQRTARPGRSRLSSDSPPP